MARQNGGFRIRPTGPTDNVLLVAELPPEARAMVRALLESANVTAMTELEHDATDVGAPFDAWSISTSDAEEGSDGPPPANGTAFNSLLGDESLIDAVQSSLDITIRPTDGTPPESLRVAIPTTDGTVIKLGRDGAWADRVIAHPQVSGRHMSVAVRGEQVTLTDHRSTCGTVVDGQRLTPETPHTLADRSSIRIGDSVTMQFRDTQELLRKALAHAAPKSEAINPTPEPEQEPEPAPTPVEDTVRPPSVSMPPPVETPTPGKSSGIAGQLLSAVFILAFLAVVAGYFYWKLVLAE
ncbi:MAG: FHA domain-containing protein [Planctomycetota bacterium]